MGGLVRQVCGTLASVAVKAGVLLALMALLPAPPAQAAVRDDTLVVGGDAHYPPFQFLDARGRPAGFDVELIRLLARDLGLEVRFELGGWDQSLARLERGEVDLVPMFASDKREDRFRFTKPYLLRYHAVFGRQGLPEVDALDALAGQRVAVQRASLAWEVLRGLDDGASRMVERSTEAATLMAVAQGDADYALVPTSIGYQTINDAGLADVVALSAPLLERRYLLAVSASRPELVAQLDSGLDRLRASGAQDRLYIEWIGNMATPRGAGWLKPALGGLLAALTLVFAFALWRRTKALSASPDRGGAAAGPSPRGQGLLAVLPDRTVLLQQLAACADRWQPGRPGFAVADVRLLGLDVIRDLADDATALEAKMVVAARLVDGFGRNEVAYVGPDRLAVLLHDIDDTAAAGAAMDRIAAMVAKRISVGSLPVDLRSRIGTAIYPSDGADAGALVRAARLACDAAERKAVPRLGYHVSLEPDRRNLTLLAELREAVATGQLGYALQPKIDLRSRRWTGAELLVRWNHPRHGPLPPSAFVPLAEQGDAIGEMTLYLIRHGLRQLRQWPPCGEALTLSVNVSANDLADPALVDGILEASGPTGSRLFLEVTETDMMRDPGRVADAIPRLRAHGIRISVDDFGTGHSPLTNLRQLSPDELKIDRSFVANVLTSQSDRAIVRATISLGHDLGASVTAEGIEDEATLAWLAEAGCDAAQGFGIARPMPPEQFAEMLPTRAV